MEAPVALLATTDSSHWPHRCVVACVSESNSATAPLLTVPLLLRLLLLLLLLRLLLLLLLVTVGKYGATAAVTRSQ
jgi:hypothetical protein